MQPSLAYKDNADVVRRHAALGLDTRGPKSTSLPALDRPHRGFLSPGRGEARLEATLGDAFNERRLCESVYVWQGFGHRPNIRSL